MATKEEVEKKLMSKQLEEKKEDKDGTEAQKEKDVKRKREIDEKELER